MDSQFWENLSQVYSQWKYLVLNVILFSIIIGLFMWISNYDIIEGNLGRIYLYVEIFLQLFIAGLFSMFLTVSVYKINYFRKFSKGKSTIGVFGAFLGLIVVGCPSCSVTIASYFGLVGFIAFLPYEGMELKFLSLPILGYAVYGITKDLKTCRVKRKKE